MKKLLFLLAFVILSAEGYGQTFINRNHYTCSDIATIRYKEQQTLDVLSAQLMVYYSRYQHDAAFHLGRLPCVRERMLYLDAMHIQKTQSNIAATSKVIAGYDNYLAKR